MKQIGSQFIALVLSMALAPLFLLVAVLIVISSGFPVIFKQKRVGLHKELFVIYKFRTMKDDKVTFFGRVLRKTGIDELSQLVNIVLGTMNFVGPRPLTPADVERMGWNAPSHASRWSVKPGITGLAQLTNVCDANVSWAKDQQYLNNRTILLDLKIVSRSLLIPLVGKPKKQPSNSIS